MPPPITFRTLGQAARQKARRLALEEAPMQVFGVASCWQNVKIYECFLKMRGFHCIGGSSVPPPTELADARPGNAPKGTSPGLGGGLNAIFCLVSGASCVGKCVAREKQWWQCSVVLAIWRLYELQLLKLLELFLFADIFADFNAVEQRQHGQQGRVKRPNVHSSGKLNVSLQVVFPLYSAIPPGRATSLALVEAPALCHCSLFSHIAGP